MQGFLGNKQPETPSFVPTQQPVAPRTSSYTQPTPKKKMSYEMPWYKESVNTRANAPTEWLFYKWVQWVADMFTWAKEWLKWTEASDKAVFEQEMNAKKQKFTQEKLKEWYTQKQIDWALKLLEDRWEFTYKPWFWTRLATNLGSRMQEMENTTDRLSNQVWTPNRTIAEWAVSYIWDVVWGIPWDVIWATIEPVVSPVIQKVVEKVWVENVKAVSDWYSKTKQENPAIIDALEWVFNIAWAVAPFTKTGQQVIKAPANVAKDIVVWATELPWKTVNKVKSFFPTPEQKLVKNLWQETTPWVVAWKTVKVPVPEKWIIERFTGWLWREKDTKVLAWRALTPTYAGKTPKQILSTVWDVEKNVKALYEKVRTGEYTWDVSTLENAANTVVTNLERIGAKIWDDVKWAVGKVRPSNETKNTVLSTLKNKIEQRSGAYSVLKNFLEDTWKWLSVQDAMKAKRVYQTEIWKLIRSGDAGTDSYSALVKWVQELSDNIDWIVEKSIGSKEFLKRKAQYSHLKKLVSDIAKSAAVEWRRSPQTFVEQLGMVENLMDAVSNPLSTAGKLFAKEIGELNTRGWAWKELMKIYDTESIGNVWKTPITKSASKPRTIKDPTKTTVNLQQSKGGFIRLPEIGKKAEAKLTIDKTISDEAKSYWHTFESLEKEFDWVLDKYLAIPRKLTKEVWDNVSSSDKFVWMLWWNDLDYSAGIKLKDMWYILADAPWLFEKIPVTEKPLVLEYLRQNQWPTYETILKTYNQSKSPVKNPLNKPEAIRK